MTYRNSKLFPSSFHAVVRQTETVVIGVYRDIESARAVAKQFRYFKSCSDHPNLETHDYRSIIEREEFGVRVYYSLSIRARPKLIPTIERMNPHLRDLVRAAVS